MTPSRDRSGEPPRPGPRISKGAPPIIGWREWVALPELGIDRIKVKVDTGARSSALHAVDIDEFRRGRTPWVRLVVQPDQRSAERSIVAEVELLGHRLVRSSDGKAAARPVISTCVQLHGMSWPIELTLASRAEMGFRMLLGRSAIRRRFLVDPGRSYCAR